MIVRLNFHRLNYSAQVGDFVLFCKTSSITSGLASSPVTVANIADTSSIEVYGKIVEIQRRFNRIRVDTNYSNGPYSFTDPSIYYFFIVKNNQVNKSSVKGYYAETSFINNSRNKAELFSVGSEIQQSSK
tara:strand:+ start:3014 stop:3403 length:390 start_codon:yes stop_codon:yes gene_type:complete